MKDKFPDIYDFLYCLGITPNYKGFDQAACAVLLSIEQPRRLSLVTKWLYPDVARVYGTTSAAVERNIRTAGRIAWRKNRVLLEALARRPLEQPPQNAQFLSFLCAGVLSASARPPHGLGEPASLAGEALDAGIADEPAGQSGGKAVVPENGILPAELQIGGDGEAVPFIAV